MQFAKSSIPHNLNHNKLQLGGYYRKTKVIFLTEQTVSFGVFQESAIDAALINRGKIARELRVYGNRIVA